MRIRSLIFILPLAASLLLTQCASKSASIKRFATGKSGGWTATWGGVLKNPDASKEYPLIMGDDVDDEGKAVAVDKDGFVYVAGDFGSKTDFDPGPKERFGGGPGGYLSKFNPDGSLEWSKNWDADVSDMVIGPDGDIYVTGGSSGGFHLIPGDSTSDTKNDYKKQPNDLGYVSRFTPDGEYVWSQSWGATGNCIAVSGAGVIYVGGTFSGTADIEPGPSYTLISSTGYSGGYISRFKLDGTYLNTISWNWEPPADFDPNQERPTNKSTPEDVENAKKWIEPGRVGIEDLVIDPDGDLYFAGAFSNAVKFDLKGGAVEKDTANFSTNYLCKLNPSGDFEWVRHWGWMWLSKGMGCAVGQDGDVYVTGTFQSFGDFDPGPAEDMHEAVDDYDIYVVKYNPSGDYQWGRTWGGKAREEGGDVAVAPDGSVYATGLYQLEADLDPGPGKDIHENAGAGATFIVKMDPNGDFIWADSFQPIDKVGYGGSGGQGIAVDSSGKVYVTGYYLGHVDFDPGPGKDIFSIIDAWRDAYLVKLNPDGSY